MSATSSSPRRTVRCAGDTRNEAKRKRVEDTEGQCYTQHGRGIVAGGGRPLRVPVILATGAVVLGLGSAAAFLLRPAPAARTPEAPRESARPRVPENEAPATPPNPSPAAERISTPRRADAAPATSPTESIAPAPTTGTLRIETDVPGATVFFDRVGKGEAPLTISDIGPGSHQLHVSAPGYERYSESLGVEPGNRTITINFKSLNLNAQLDVVHKHGLGSCKGRLIGSNEELRYEASKGKDSFRAAFADVTTFDVDYAANTLRVRTRDGRTFNFQSSNTHADRLSVFFRDVDQAWKRTIGR